MKLVIKKEILCVFVFWLAYLLWLGILQNGYLFAEESKLATGFVVAESILSHSDKAKEIPETIKADLLKEIDRIEKSKFVRVPYDKMSKWRKDQFDTMVSDWIEKFPEKDFRTKTILEAHTAQNMGFIAQLFVVPPTDDAQKFQQKQNAYNQLVKLEKQIVDDVKLKLGELSEKMKLRCPALGDDFHLYTAQYDDFFKCSFVLEDDLNPFLRVSVSDAEFDKLQKNVRNLIKGFQVQEQIYINDLATIELKTNDKTISDKDKSEYIADIKNRMSMSVLFEIHSDFVHSCNSLIDEAYRDVIPSNVMSDYKNYAAEVSQLVDSSSIVKAALEKHELKLKQIQESDDKHKKEFDMVIASRPQSVHREVPARDTGFSQRIVIIGTVNIVVICVLLFLYYLMKKKDTNLK
jgi:hypothetical protein